MDQEIPPGFKCENDVCWGYRKEGLFEIKLHNLVKRNAFNFALFQKLGDLILMADQDPKAKVVLLHGGKFFSAGADIGGLDKKLEEAHKNTDKEALKRSAYRAQHEGWSRTSLIIAKCTKPFVAVVRGGCHGIGFTMLSGADFVYCGPETIFKTPFMGTGQAPEGSSTLTFPQQLGFRLAREVLLLDRPLSAQDAVACGFSNGIIEDLGGEWFDIDKVPAIAKLLKTDQVTLLGGKKLIQDAMDFNQIQAAQAREADYLAENSLSPAFIKKMGAFLKMLDAQRAAKRKAKL